VFCFQFVFYILIKFVHIDIYQKLACEIAQRQAITRGSTSWKAIHYLPQEPHNILVGYIPLKDCKQNLVVYRGKELADVAFEHPAGAGMVFRYTIGKMPELVHRFMRALPYAAGVGVMNKSPVEEWVEFAIERVVK